MKITIEFDTDNAAFEDNFEDEVQRVMNRAALAIICSENMVSLRRGLRDINGNTIGSVDISE